MFFAKILDVEKHNLIDCILTIIIATLVVSIVVPLLPSASTSAALINFYGFFVTGIVFKFMLKTNYFPAY